MRSGEASIRQYGPFNRVFKQIGMLALYAVALSSLAWSTGPQSQFKFKPVVQAGDAAPVPPILSSVGGFAFNDQGQTAVFADDGILLKSGNQVIPIVGVGDPAPGGGVYLSIAGPTLGPQGQVAWRGVVTFPGTSGLYIYTNGTITLLIADGTTASDGESIFPGSVTFNASGEMLVNDVFTGSLFLFSNGTLTRLVGSGDPAPGGGFFTILLESVINQSHQVAFHAFTSNGANGIFLLSGGTVTKIIASGDIMPDGVPFGFPEAPAMNDAGQVVFGGVSNSIADTGIFFFSNGQLSVLIPEFTVLPTGGLFEFSFTTSINDAGEIAFTATDINNNSGVFLFANGQIQTVASTGQSAPDGGTFQSGSEVGSSLNSSGQVLFVARRFQQGDALYLFSAGQISRVIGKGDPIARQPVFEFPTALALGGGDNVLIADSTFPGGAGSFTATPSHGGNPGQASLAVHVGQGLGTDGLVDFLFGSVMNQGNEVVSGVASSDANGAVVVSSNNSPSVVADSAPSSAVDPDPVSLAVDDNGDIAFLGFAPATQTRGVFLNSAGQTQLLLDAATPLPDGSSVNNISGLSLNNQLQLAFMATPDFASTSIMLLSAGQLTTLATSGTAAPGGGIFQIFFDFNRQAPVINNQGSVVFAASLVGTDGGFFGSSGIYLFKNGTLTRIVGPDDPSPDGGVFLFADAPSINSQGDVTFFAETSAFSFGAFVYHNGQFQQVAIAGDVVNGEILAFVDQPVFNNGGDIAFTATLLDGRTAVFVAAVPPTSTGTDWFAAAAGAPPSLDEVNWQKKKRDLMKSEGRRRQLGPNIRLINQPNQ